MRVSVSSAIRVRSCLLTRAAVFGKTLTRQDEATDIKQQHRTLAKHMVNITILPRTLVRAISNFAMRPAVVDNEDAPPGLHVVL